MAVVLSGDCKQVLLLRREIFFLWDLPGGGIEKNEDPAEAAVRETSEEVGYDIVAEKFVGCYLHQSVYGRGDQLTYAFRGRVVGGNAKHFGLEVTGLKWCDVTRLPRTLEPLHRQIIADTLADGVPVERRIDFALWKLYPARVVFFILRFVNEAIRLVMKTNHRQKHTRG
ncbi:MAG: NUDIX hydrolase [Chloroflexi bacterium]|nr:NUDIX hydrolase [Chloroflexota bacterium]